MQIFVRRGSDEDIEILSLLETERRESLDQFRGGSQLSATVKPVAPNWQSALDDDDTAIFVVGDRGEVMGFALARKSKRENSRIATVEQIFVTKNARGLGLGDNLLATVLQWAKTEGLAALDGYALPGDRETKNLFERAGLVARLITVTTDLLD
ncbi:MAG: GNAT family N-acetyltransferase [Actinobacteria bacterium]|nr:GNAT family N-acetyltransferase [Actinomycetota bacterium]